MSLKDDALIATIMKALILEIGDQYQASRPDITTGLRELRKVFGSDSIKIELPDGTEVASATLDSPKPSVDVHDEPGFLAWVRNHHADEIVPVVRDSFRKTVMGRLVVAGDEVVDEATGEAVTWASVRPAGEPQSFTLRFAGPGGKTGRAAIAAAWAAGQLDGYAPGPRALPGSEATP